MRGAARVQALIAFACSREIVSRERTDSTDHNQPRIKTMSDINEGWPAGDIQEEYKRRREHYMAFNEDAERDGLDWRTVMHDRHVEFYLWLADVLKIKDECLPRKLADIREHLAKDENLNSIPLNEWDRKHHNVTRHAARAGLKSWSLSDTVCTLKCYAVKRAREVQS